MPATVRVYRSTDASAPVLTGVAGGLLPVLDACLVTGYGGSRGFAAAGWTKPFPNSGNIGMYMMAAATQGGTAQMCLQVDDSATLNARVRGYETMSSLTAGTGPFPLDYQINGGGYLYKSATADATARPWILFATERTFYLITAANSTVWGAIDVNQGGLGFGAFYSYKPGDAFNCFMLTTSIAGGNVSRMGAVNTLISAGIFGALGTLFMARAHTAIGGSYSAGRHVPSCSGSSMTALGLGLGSTYPDPITGGVKLTRNIMTEIDGGGNAVERGFLPGLWAPLHNPPGYHMDTFPGTNDLAGRNFVLWTLYNGALVGRGAFETTGNWDM